jgi:hypothetical protein
VGHGNDLNFVQKLTEDNEEGVFVEYYPAGPTQEWRT